jgi:hypothetical protein
LTSALNRATAALKARAARGSSAGPRDDSAIEEGLVAYAELVDQFNSWGDAITLSQFGWAAGAFGVCLVTGPETCAVAIALLVAAEPYYEAATLLDVAGILTVELGPNALSGLTTIPANSVQIQQGTTQTLAVQGHFVSKLSTSLALSATAGQVVSDWITGAIPFGPVLDPILSPVIGSIANGMIGLGLANLVPETGPASQDVSLTVNSVQSCSSGSSPSPGVSFFVDQNLSTISGLQVMSSPQECDFVAYSNQGGNTGVLWAGESAPATALDIQVVPNTATCAQFPTQLIAFTKVYGVTAAIADGDRLVVGDPASPFWSTVWPDLSTPLFTNEQYCGAVTLAPACAATAYVPTQAERVGDFSAFASVLAAPGIGPFPGGIIPQSMLGPGGAWAWRVSSVQGCGQ